jgi:hypothetical protein
MLGAAWTGTAAAATTEQAAPAASGTEWCGFDYDTCVQDQYTFMHYGYQVGTLYWAGTDNTCVPEHQCNGYYFDWWE